MVVLQTPEQKPKVQKPQLNDRTGVWENRTKFNQEQARIINDGIYWMEQEIWNKELESEQSTPHQKVSLFHFYLFYNETRLSTWLPMSLKSERHC